MATEVKIPALGESITSGILTSWHVKTGDYVEAGQPIFDLETDKITSEGIADVSGIIELKVDEEEEVEIGSVVAIIDESQARPAEATTETASVEDTQQKPAGEVQHPPSVRRISAESGVDPAKVAGTGKAGRVTKGDMLKAVATPSIPDTSGQEGQPVSAQVPEPASSRERTTRRRMSPLRKTIAKRLVEAQQSTAMLTTFNEVDMSAVMSIRKNHQDAFVSKHGVKLGFMSFFVKAAVHALKEVTTINARIEGDEIVTNNYYDIGVAVSTPKGLMVPVVRNADMLSFAGVEQAIIGYANKAKEGKISIDDLQGGVFTISNGGVFGSMLSTPILNTPQSAILGMHTIQQRPVAVSGEVVIRPMMYLALSYDHRLVDGREAVSFLIAVKQVIEDPQRLLFGI